MKQIASLLVCIIILLSFSFSYAEPETILFRSIPWGLSKDEVQTLLDADNINVRTYMFDEFTSAANFMYGGDQLNYNGDVICHSTFLSQKLHGLEVAGYKVKRLMIIFARLPAEDGLLKKDIEYTSFIAAYYLFTPISPDDAYPDIENKLSGLYGEPLAELNRKVWGNSVFTVWKAKDGSMVSIEKKQLLSKCEIYIRYISGNADKLLSDAFEAVKRQESINSESNIDGL